MRLTAHIALVELAPRSGAFSMACLHLSACLNQGFRKRGRGEEEKRRRGQEGKSRENTMTNETKDQMKQGRSKEMEKGTTKMHRIK